VIDITEVKGGTTITEDQILLVVAVATTCSGENMFIANSHPFKIFFFTLLLKMSWSITGLYMSFVFFKLACRRSYIPCNIKLWT